MAIESAYFFKKFNEFLGFWAVLTKYFLRVLDAAYCVF